MRDLALVAFIAILIPYILRQPWLGVVVGAWISLMNPHRYAFGFANNFPFALIIALLTVAAVVFGKKKVEFPRHSVMIMILLLMFWFTVTLLFALEPDAALQQWVQVMKVFLLVILSALLIRSRKEIDVFVWVLVGSIGFFGVKGGLFTIATGGVHRVYGPPGGWLCFDNKRHLHCPHHGRAADVLPKLDGQEQIDQVWLVRVRGAVAGGGARQPVAGSVARRGRNEHFPMAKEPQEDRFWLSPVRHSRHGDHVHARRLETRMRSIENYEEDGSAMGRINSWTMAYNLANAAHRRRRVRDVHAGRSRSTRRIRRMSQRATASISDAGRARLRRAPLF
jgi:hypothetical protein